MPAPKNAITTKDTMKVFGVSHMALFLWRQGTANKTPLPIVEVEDSRSVYYMPKVLKSWAKENGVEILVDPNSFVGAERPKPGPKAKPAAKKKVAKPPRGKAATYLKVKASPLSGKTARKRKSATH